MRRTALVIALVALFLLPTVSALSNYAVPNTNTISTKQVTYTIDTNATLKLALGWYPDNLNPLATSSAYDWDILGLIFDSLYTPNPYDYFNLEADIPWMLTEMPEFTRINDSYGYWTLHLKDNIYFFDGVKLTADDVVFTYDFIKWLGEYNDPWYDVWYVVDKAEKVNDFTVKVYVKAGGLIAARYAIGIIVFPKHIYEQATTWGGTNGTFPDWDVTQDMVMAYEAKSPSDPILTGYGPFKLKSWSPEGSAPSEATTFLLERNPKYFMRAVDEKGNIVVEWKDWRDMTAEDVDLHGPYVKYIQYTVITDPESLKNAVLNGEIDIAAELEFGIYITEFQEKGFTTSYSWRLGFGHTFINTKSPTPAAGEINLLGQAAFRRAIAYAYDKRRVCSEVWGGWAAPIDIPVPKVMGEWSIEVKGMAPGSYADHDVDSALAELEKLGIKDYDNDGWLEWNASDPNSEITLRIEGTEATTVRGIVTVLAESLEDIGIHVETLFVDFNQLLNDLFGGTFEIMFFGFGLGRLPTFLEGFASWGIFSILGGWSNDTYDQLIEDAFYVQTNMTKIYEDVWQAELIYWYELPLIPIYQNLIVGVYRQWTAETGVGWLGVTDIPGAPVANWYTIMRIIKPTGVKTVGPTIPVVYIGIGVGVIVVVIAIIAVLLRRKPAE